MTDVLNTLDPEQTLSQNTLIPENKQYFQDVLAVIFSEFNVSELSGLKILDYKNVFIHLSWNFFS